MIRLDWNPFSDIVVTAVWVPIFRPAQLPRTAPLAVTQGFRPAPVQERGMQDWLGFEAFLHPPDTIYVNTMVPDPSIQNSQVGIRAAGRAGGIDMSLSYYHGRWGIPTPAWATQNPIKINGVTQPSTVNAVVMWPRVDVLGADIAGSIEALKGLGYWVEAGVFFPQYIQYGAIDNLTNSNLAVSFRPNGGDTTSRVGYDLIQRPQGSKPEQLPTVIPSTPFLKLTAGFDYSWNKYIYTNVQYVYGFIDEFGAGQSSFAKVGSSIGDLPRREARIGHYLVVGSDVKLANDAVLIRLFGAFKVPQIGDEPGLDGKQKFTAVIFPQIAWSVWDATELSLGAFIFLGDSDTKFGDPAAGASEIFCKARFTY
jgi:hypothetical protein